MVYSCFVVIETIFLPEEPMSKVIRLNPTDQRTWRQNQSVLLDPEGNPVRNVSFAESRALADTEKRARHLRQPVRVEVKDGATVTTIVSVPAFISRETLIVKTTIDGHEVVSGREFFKQRVLAAHGECQLRSHTGQFMCSIRDPNVVRPSAKDAMRNAPRPEACPCKDWGEPHAGRHHPICEWNVKAPPDERAHPEDSIQSMNVPLPVTILKVEKPSILDVPSRKLPPPRRPVPATVSEVIPLPMTVQATESTRALSPAECVCQEWAKSPSSEEGKHHPICQWKDAWETLQSGKEPMFLVNLTTGEVGRAATIDEINAARGERGYTIIGSDQYGVIPESEVNARKGAA